MNENIKTYPKVMIHSKDRFCFTENYRKWNCHNNFHIFLTFQCGIKTIQWKWKHTNSRVIPLTLTHVNPIIKKYIGTRTFNIVNCSFLIVYWITSSWLLRYINVYLLLYCSSMDLFFNIEETDRCVDQSCLFSFDSHEQILDIDEAHSPNTKPSFRD